MPDAELSRYTDEHGNVLELRPVMTLPTREQYTRIMSSGGDREDAWQRAVEFLFERLVVSWEVAGVAYRGQRELLDRWRVAGVQERAGVRAVLREHCAEHFPELSAP
jgi:hypothetical protein